MPRLFGEKLQYLRLQQNATQTAVAQRLGLARQAYVSNLEAGRRVPSLDLVLRVANVFHVTTDYLLRDTVPVEGVVGSALTQGQVSKTASLFGTKLRALRIQRNLSQRDLTRQLELASRAYISNLEAGRKMPSLDLVIQLADLFGVTADYLLRDPIPIEITAEPTGHQER
jgi:transcriptional regulator with XRE-family HTH domain